MPSTSAPLPVNRSMPACSIIPVLDYHNIPKAIEWLCNTLGFTERWRVGNHRAQLAFGNGCIAITEHRADLTAAPPSGHSLMVRVVDVNQHYEHTKQLGAMILQPPADFPYGERQYSLLDIGGHIWTFSQSIADLAPEDWGGVSME